MPTSTHSMSNDTNSPNSQPSRPAPITAAERLATIYNHPGPFTTVYLATTPLLPDRDPDTEQRWRELRQHLESQSAPRAALEAVEARLALPAPEDSAAIAVLAAADGTTVVDHGLEPPAHDFSVVDTLPYAAPLLEWHQRRVAHLVVTVDNIGADIAMFGLDHYQRLDTVDGQDDELASLIASRAAEIDADLIVLAGDQPDTAAMTDRLRLVVPASCRIATEPSHLASDDLADATVRHVSDATARATVGHLRDLRFLASHGAAVDGTEATIQAIARQTADLLLIHDDPADQRRCWIGSRPHQLSLQARTGYSKQARLVDAVIRSAVLGDIPIHIIPSTGSTGPADNTAALTHDFDARVGQAGPSRQ